MKNYKTPIMDVITFDTENVIATSYCTGHFNDGCDSKTTPCFGFNGGGICKTNT